jgi:hypothetical protein
MSISTERPDSEPSSEAATTSERSPEVTIC